MKTDWEVLDEVANAIGRPDFDENVVIAALKREADAMKERGENPGSLWAVAGILPGIVKAAKERY